MTIVMADTEITLREWMTDKFNSLEKQLSLLRESIVGKDRFEAWCNRVTILEMSCEEQEKRIYQMERSIWLMQIIVGVLVPIVTSVFIALLIAWLTGSMEISFK